MASGDGAAAPVGVGAVLGSLRLALDLVNKSKGPKAMDAGIIAGSVKRDFGGQAFALGQTLVMSVESTKPRPFWRRVPGARRRLPRALATAPPARTAAACSQSC